MLPDWVYQECPGVSAVHREMALARQTQLTKPTGALGRLEHIAVELAGLQQTERPRAARVPIIIFAGDQRGNSAGAGGIGLYVRMWEAGRVARGGRAT